LKNQQRFAGYEMDKKVMQNAIEKEKIQQEEEIEKQNQMKLKRLDLAKVHIAQIKEHQQRIEAEKKEHFDYGLELARQDNEYNAMMKKKQIAAKQDKINKKKELNQMKQDIKVIKFLQEKEEKEQDQEIERWATMKENEMQMRKVIEKEWFE
jgi:hypothetical protein